MWTDECRRVTSTHADLHYEVYGEGPPVLIVPGLNELTLHYWQNVPALVRGGYRVAVMNLRGHHLSPCPERYCHPYYFADDIAAICAAERWSRVALVCESAGGWGGLRLAATCPELVAGLLLMGSPAGVYSPQNFDVACRAVAKIRSWIAARVPRGLDFDGPDPAKAFLSRQLTMLGSRDGGVFPCSHAYLATMVDESTWLRPAQLAGYAVSTLIVGGDHDTFLDAGFQRHVATLIPGARLSDFQDAGHEPYWEQPERFNRVALEWLTEIGWPASCAASR